MKIAVGTPIHDSKEYGVYKWLDSMKALKVGMFDSISFHIVDTSDTPDFMHRVTEYTKKIELSPVYIGWLPNMAGKEEEHKRMWGRETFRRSILTEEADVWLSWECDIVAEPDAFQILKPLLKSFDIILTTYPSRTDPTEIVGGIGFCLVKTAVIEKFDFLEGGGFALCNPKRPSCHYSGDAWLIQRAAAGGFKAADITNVVKLEHLDG